MLFARFLVPQNRFFASAYFLLFWLKFDCYFAKRNIDSTSEMFFAVQKGKKIVKQKLQISTPAPEHWADWSKLSAISLMLS
jgi:hypothetical protein